MWTWQVFRWAKTRTHVLSTTPTSTHFHPIPVPVFSISRSPPPPHGISLASLKISYICWHTGHFNFKLNFFGVYFTLSFWPLCHWLFYTLTQRFSSPAFNILCSNLMVFWLFRGMICSLVSFRFEVTCHLLWTPYPYPLSILHPTFLLGLTAWNYICAVAMVSYIGIQGSKVKPYLASPEMQPHDRNRAQHAPSSVHVITSLIPWLVHRPATPDSQ